MSEITEQIKERIPVADLVGEYLKLEKAGLSNLKALCPFHNEKTPSFMVNTERNFWYCFGCQKGGDIFTFIQEMEGLEFREALERLAERAGVEIPRYSPLQKEQKSQKQKIREILETSVRFFEHQLKNSQKGQKILDYLAQRGLNEAEISKFRLGYAPGGWRTTLDFLTSRGYQIPDILKTGLLVLKNGDNNFSSNSNPNPGQNQVYDRFRDRIMFPIIDVAGQTVGFSARVAPGQDESSAKYINTPETLVYNKSRILYGLYQGKSQIKKQDFTVVVEGQMDVIASHAAGVENVVAISGTAMTGEQSRLIKRYSKNAKLCFDRDPAGQNATAKSVQTCLRQGLEVEVVMLPQGKKDAGDLVQADPESWKTVLANSQPVMDYFFKTIFQKYNPENPRDRKLIGRDLLNIIKDIADPIEKNYWIKKLALKLEVEEELLFEVLDKFEKKDRKNIQNQESQLADSRSAKITGQPRTKTRPEILEERLLGLILLFPNELAQEAEKLEPDFFENQSELWQKIKQQKTDPNFSLEEKRTADQLISQLKYLYDPASGFSENELDPFSEWELAVSELRQIRKQEKLKKLDLEIRKAEEAQNEEQAQKLTEEFEKLSRS